MPSSGVQNVNLDHSFQILPVLNLQPLKEPSLQRRQLIHQIHEYNTALQSPSPSRNLQDQHLEPKTHLQHQQELTFRAPERAATALHLHETWAKNQQKCSVQRKKNPALIYSDCSSSLGTNNAWGCLTVVPSHFIKNTPISTVGFCISLFQPLCKGTEII